MPEDSTWQDVSRVLLVRWPAGPGNKGWEHEQLEGYVAELQEDMLSPHWAIVGLRASGSGFIPSVGEVRELAAAVKGPPSAEAIQKAEERMRRESRERAARLLGRAAGTDARELEAG